MYVDLATLKSFLRMDADDDSEDALLTLAIMSAQRAIEVSCNQVFTDPVPETIQLATLLQASRLIKRRDSPFGVAGSPEMGNELRLLAKLDPDVALLVSTERNWWGAV